MRFQLKRPQVSLMLWVDDGRWHRSGPFPGLAYSAQRHALLVPGGPEVIHYAPRLQRWEFSILGIRHSQVSQLLFTAGPELDGNEGELELWIRRESDWLRLHRAPRFVFSCASGFLGVEENAPLLRYSGGGNAWSVLSPRLRGLSIEDVQITEPLLPPA